MTNYNERLDEVFETLNSKAREERASCIERNNWEGYNSVYKRLESDAKQAITSLTKELVDEQIVQALKELKEEVIGEVPSKMNTDNWKYDKRVAELKLWQHQAIDNKIKELGG